jgi:hypothetical protein
MTRPKIYLDQQRNLFRSDNTLSWIRNSILQNTINTRSAARICRTLCSLMKSGTHLISWSRLSSLAHESIGKSAEQSPLLLSCPIVLVYEETQQDIPEIVISIGGERLAQRHGGLEAQTMSAFWCPSLCAREGT